MYIIYDCIAVVNTKLNITVRISVDFILFSSTKISIIAVYCMQGEKLNLFFTNQTSMLMLLRINAILNRVTDVFSRRKVIIVTIYGGSYVNHHRPSPQQQWSERSFERRQRSNHKRSSTHGSGFISDIRDAIIAVNTQSRVVFVSDCFSSIQRFVTKSTLFD